jgi:hypothetical protein
VIEGDSDFRDPRSASESKVKNAASLRWYQSLSLEDSRFHRHEVSRHLDGRHLLLFGKHRLGHHRLRWGHHLLLMGHRLLLLHQHFLRDSVRVHDRCFKRRSCRRCCGLRSDLRFFRAAPPHAANDEGHAAAAGHDDDEDDQNQHEDRFLGLVHGRRGGS